MPAERIPVSQRVKEHVSALDNPHEVDKGQVGLGDVENLKGNLEAVTDPGVNDDSITGYAVGSRWVNLTTNREYVCVYDSPGAAIWKCTVLDTDRFIWNFNGQLSIASVFDGLRVAPKNGLITSVYLTLNERGRNGDTIIDINKGVPGIPHTTQQNNIVLTTLYTTQANRPSLAGLNSAMNENAFIKGVLPDVFLFSAGDIFSADIDAKATQGSDLTVTMEVEYE